MDKLETMAEQNAAFAAKLGKMFREADKGFGMVAGKMDGADDGGQ